ncbi:MAG: MFS transporter [Chloroflexota bacterium]|nr:MFS transporter [Chloroflexota bacterium]
MRNPRAFRVYLLYTGATSFFFALIFTISAIYRLQAAGLNPLQLVLVGTVLEVTYFLFNVPLGAIADSRSRKLSVVVGVFLFAAGFVLEGTTPTFAAILAAQVIEGIAYCMVEGALEAWITDEVGEENVGSVFLRGSQVGNLAGLLGIGGSVALASLTLGLPILVGGVLFLGLGIYLVFVMPETAYQRPSREQGASLGGALRDMENTLREGAHVVRRRPLALTILAIAAIFGGFSEGFDRLWEAHFVQSVGLPRLGGLDPVVWFGIISAGSSVVGFVSSWIASRTLNAANPAVAVRALFGLNTLLIASVVVFALAGNFALALAAFWGGAMSRNLQGPVYMTWLN